MAAKLDLDEEEIVRLYTEKRMSTTEIAALLGIGATTVTRRLNSHGVVPQRDQRPKRHSVRAQNREGEVIAAYRDGATRSEVAEAFGIDRITVLNILKRHNEPRRDDRRRSRREFSNEERDRMVELRRSGWTYDRIAREVGTSQPKAREVLRAMGFPPLYEIREHRVRHTNAGYVQVWIDPDSPLAPMAHKNHYALEHRIVMAQHLGRALSSQETVHHINGDKTDNRIENLQLRSGRHGKHAAFQCADCGSRNVVPTTLL